VDDDRLEAIVLKMLADRGLTLTAIESGMDGLLIRKIPHAASLPDLTPDSLMQALHAARTESKADIALGVSVYVNERAAEMAMITPRGEKTHRITYGGPPKSLARWAMNLALNWLRTTLEEIK
jgi:nicotinamide mononucleotide (NMN) deamidase PncC